MPFIRRSLSLYDLIRQLGLSLAPRDAAAADRSFKGVAGLDQAQPDQLTFLAKPEYRQHLATSRAGAVILKDFVPECPAVQILAPNPYLTFAKISLLFHQPDYGTPGIDPRAVVSPTARLGEGVKIMPFAYVGEQAVIGARTVIFPGVYIGDHSTIGEDCVLHPNVVLYENVHVGQRNIVHAGTVLGADGFGFALGTQEVVKIPQIGTVRLGNDVECGAQVSIDRATLGETTVGDHTKFDDKVHLGHNVTVGQRCVFAAQFSVAGSTRLGDDIMAGGLSGVAGHLHVASGTRIGGMTGITGNTTGGETYMGFPAIPAGQWRRQAVYLKRLPDTEKSVNSLQERVKALEEALARLTPG